MKKIVALLFLFTSTMFWNCSKENIKTEKPAIPMMAKVPPPAGNKYHVEIVYRTQVHVLGSCVWKYVDKGGFTVTLDGSTSGSISNITNKNSEVTLIRNNTTCDVELVAPNKGNVDVGSTAQVAVDPGSHTVFIGFNPIPQIRTPKFSVTCSPGQTTYQGGGLGPAIPEALQFTDNGQKQVIQAKPTTITITPL